MQFITGTTKLLGVIGDPVEHSLSPVMHNRAIASLGVDYVYLPFPIKAENLEVAIAGFAAIGVVGFNVTIPHKQAIVPFLASVTDIARAVGAVNTVWRTESGWRGANTDVEGFIAPLQAQERDWGQIVPLILGYGGAARAVVVGLTQLGCPKIHVVGRNPQKLSQFQQSWANSPLPVAVETHRWEELPELISQADLVVNATPVGMHPHADRSPLDGKTLEGWKAGAIAYDLIYNPNPTQFLQQAKERGAIAIDGLEMLVQQGAAALKIWLVQTPPTEVMRQALQEHLGLR